MGAGHDPAAHRPGAPSPASGETSSVRPHLGVWSIVRDSFRLWGAEWRDLYLAALLVEGVVVLIQVFIGSAYDAVIELEERDFRWAGGTALALLWGSLAHHLVLGLAERVVASDRFGHPRPPMRTIVKNIPWIKLGLSDVAFIVVAVLAVVGLVVGSLVVQVLFALVAPIISLQRCGVLQAFRRSARLVLPVFWPAAVLVLGALAVRQVLTQVVAQLAQQISHADEVHVIAHGLVALVVSPFTVLPAILMTFELLDQRGELEPE